MGARGRSRALAVGQGEFHKIAAELQRTTETLLDTKADKEWVGARAHARTHTHTHTLARREVASLRATMMVDDRLQQELDSIRESIDLKADAEDVSSKLARRPEWRVTQSRVTKMLEKAQGRLERRLGVSVAVPGPFAGAASGKSACDRWVACVCVRVCALANRARAHTQLRHDPRPRRPPHHARALHGLLVVCSPRCSPHTGRGVRQEPARRAAQRGGRAG